MDAVEVRTGGKEMILAIDPGNIETGWALISEVDCKPVAFGKDENREVVKVIRKAVLDYNVDEIAIEMVASYGMPVGREVFDTCVWIGRFSQVASALFACANEAEEQEHIHYVLRREEKLDICHSPTANDATIRQALVDRFAYGTRNYGKGTKKEPGFFYGFKADVWQAYAVGITYLDRRKKEQNAEEGDSKPADGGQAARYR